MASEPYIEDYEEDPVEYLEKIVRLFMTKDLETAWKIRQRIRLNQSVSKTEIVALDILKLQYSRDKYDFVGKQKYLLMPRELKQEFYVKYNTMRALLFNEKI